MLGYLYSFPFLSMECGITVDDNYIQPLFKHCINIKYPTMALIGMPYLVHPPLISYLQVRGGKGMEWLLIEDISSFCRFNFSWNIWVDRGVYHRRKIWWLQQTRKWKAIGNSVSKRNKRTRWDRICWYSFCSAVIAVSIQTRGNVKRNHFRMTTMRTCVN